MLTTSPVGATPREIAREIDEVRREMADLTARRAVTSDLGDRVDIIHELQLASRRLAALEEQLSINNWERRG